MLATSQKQIITKLNSILIKQKQKSKVNQLFYQLDICFNQNIESYLHNLKYNQPINPPINKQIYKQINQIIIKDQKVETLFINNKKIFDEQSEKQIKKLISKLQLSSFIQQCVFIKSIE
ncbi:hypothetical protein ABPG73_005741 [Tetrahymena malaccensis]